MIDDPVAISQLGALSHPVRLRAFRLLARQDSSGIPSGQIAQLLGVPPTAMSFHLAVLQRSDLLLSRREGRKIVYCVNSEATRTLLAFLASDCSNH